MLLPSTARDIFQQFTETLQSPDTSADQCLALFADDAVFEFPRKAARRIAYRLDLLLAGFRR
jgi:hypothetical protein